MYVRDCHIENVGPIQSLDLQFLLREDGTPKPVVLLGENGTGKSTLLSMVADALLLFQQRVFTDITPGQSTGSSQYLRLAGGVNQRNTAPYGLSALRFEGNGSIEVWVEKTGRLKAEDAKTRLDERFGAGFTWQNEEDTFKDVSKLFSTDALKRDFAENSYCYFPSEREERPSWLNDESIGDASLFRLGIPLQGKLGKPLVVTGSIQSCIPWLMDVILDANTDLGFAGMDEQGELYRTNGSPVGMRSRQLEGVLNDFLRSLLGNSDARFAVGPRANRLFRLCIAQDKDIMPNLSCLSSGQAALLGIFMTVLRYSDCQNATGIGSDLGNMSGIVLIDEADAHLHTRLQYEVLPYLISAFPRVQFLITSHSPVLLLGMEKQFGRDGFLAMQMPLGMPCDSDDYPEATATVRCFAETKEFKHVLAAKLNETTLPEVLMEGRTDVRYIQTAFHALGHDETLARIDITTLAIAGSSGDVNGGAKSMDSVERLYKSGAPFSRRNTLLLYDSDVQKPDSECGALTVRSLPWNASSCIKKGIENLLPPGVVVPDDEKYFSMNSNTGDYGQALPRVFEKERLCNDLCNVADQAVFEVFGPVIEIIENWLNSLPGARLPLISAGTDSSPQTPVASVEAGLN